MSEACSRDERADVGMRRRCCACGEPFEVPAEPETVEAYTCGGCVKRGCAPMAGWEEAWERSLRMQGRWPRG
jgi:hypothetical protein